MRHSLKCYQVVMKTLAPVYVGSGREIGKKEYILDRSKVGIPDIQRLYEYMKKKGIGNLFEDYLLGYSNATLTDWLKKQNIRSGEIEPILKYALDCGDAVLEKGENRLKIMECIKDPYGKPYIPGSSLKGMFRTILLGADIMHSPQKYQRVKQGLLENADMKSSRISYLKRDAAALEEACYRTLRRKIENPKDAVNDILQGFIVSDSEALSIEDLVLCQKVDLHTKGIERNIPILRECIKPDREIRFTLTVDSSSCSVTTEKLMEAVKDFMGNYHKNFGAAFQGMKASQETDVFLGGGCGFVSKTVIYPLLGKREGLETVQKVFEKTNVPRMHKHIYDREYGASPHILKCTKYQGKKYQMGLCRIESLEASE